MGESILRDDCESNVRFVIKSKPKGNRVDIPEPILLV